MELFLNEKLGKISYEIDLAAEASPALILAHGAGAGMDHPFMVSLGKMISAKGINVIRFNFPYKEQGRKMPGSPKHAIEAWKGILSEVKRTYSKSPIFISGKSYGGRMGSHLLHEYPDKGVDGIIYFGFPLHAPGRDSIERAAHLAHIRIPQLFLQGTRDKLANIELMKEVTGKLSNAELHEIDSADHSFNVPKAVASKEEMMELLAQKTAEWIANN